MSTEDGKKTPDEVVDEIFELLRGLEAGSESEQQNIYDDAALLAKDNGVQVYELLANAMYPTIEKELNAELGNRSLYISILFGRIGEAALPALVPILAKSEWAHHSLGHIGSDKSTDVLIKELRSSNWRRVAAAATGIGISKNRKALPALRAIYAKLPREMPVGEVSIACEYAIKELETMPASFADTKVVHAEAASINEAREIIKGQIPNGLSILEETIISDGFDKVVTALAPTAEEAKSKAKAELPDGASVMNEREIKAASQKRLVLEAMDEQTATSLAEKHRQSDESVKCIDLITVGDKFLGIWKRPNRYEVTFVRDCTFEIRYKPRVNISAKIGDIREQGRIIELSYPSWMADPIPSNARRIRVYEECEMVPVGTYNCPICGNGIGDLSSRNPNVVIMFQLEIGTYFWWSLVPHCGKKFLVSNTGF